MKVDVYTTSAKKKGQVEVNDAVFARDWNGDLVHQTVVSMQSNLRRSTAHTKDRSEVRGGGKKPWRQKGTGRARHGSSRSPIWRTGGVTFGPRNEKDYGKKINRKARVNSLYCMLSQKLRDAQVLFVDSLGIKEAKTKAASDALKGLEGVAGFETLNTKNPVNILVVTAQRDENTVTAMSNLAHVTVTDALNINTLQAAKYRYIIIENPEEADKVLWSRHSSQTTLA